MLKRRRPEWFREDLGRLLDLLRQGAIRPLIADRLPLEEAAVAHERLVEGAVAGKLVLECADEGTA